MNQNRTISPYWLLTLNDAGWQSNVSDTPSNTEYALMKDILSALYCNPFSQEFRRPVHILHPAILQSYLQIVKQPIDLATMILKTHRKEYESLESFRNDIKLLFTNAITFNEDTLHMVSTSKHLLYFSRLLWEQKLGLPFDGQRNREEFLRERLQTRRDLYDFVKNDALYNVEIDDMHNLLKNIKNIPDIFKNIHEQLLILTANIQEITKMSFSIMFSNFISTCITYLISLQDSKEFDNEVNSPMFMLSEILLHDDGTFILEKLNNLDDLSLLYLRSIDECIGQVLMGIIERKCRGFNLSAVWARPYRLVWAQPSKTPWWPGMVIAGTGVPRLLGEINCSRLPIDIARDLSKVRPKSIPGSTEGSVLVEFFGSHDYGWVRTDSLHNFTIEAYASLRKEKGVSGQCSQDSIKEAMESATLLEAVDALVEDLTYPNIEELELELEAYTPDITVSSPKSKLSIKYSNQNVNKTTSNKMKGGQNKKGKKSVKVAKEPIPNKPQNQNKTNNALMKSIDVDLPSDLSLKDRAFLRTLAYSIYLNQVRPICTTEAKSKRWGPRGKKSLDSEGGGGKSDSNTQEKFKKSKTQKSVGDIHDNDKGLYEDDDENTQDEEEGQDDEVNEEDDDDETVDETETYEDEEVPELPISMKTAPPAKRAYHFHVRLPAFSSERGEDIDREIELFSNGCTMHFAGDGVIHTRKVDFNTPVFFLEGKKREARKRVLRLQLDELQKEAERLQSASAKRAIDKAAADTSHVHMKDTAGNTKSHNLNSNPRNSFPKKLPGKVGMIAQLEEKQQNMNNKLAHISTKDSDPPHKKSGSVLAKKKVSIVNDSE